MWGEFIPTIMRMNEQIYPRIAALAEVAWSKKRNSYDDFLSRLVWVKNRWRCWNINFNDNDAK